uniref:Extended synaptotagmin-like protein 2a n=1 Tax=Neogobius melanostomus TaxID=47308 RepID=A0A8C6WVL5_9GOBI
MDSAMNGPNSRPNGPIPPAAYGPDALPDPQDLEDDPMSSLTAVSQMWMKFGKTFLVILPIYILGYFEFSFSWILVGLAAMFYWKRNYSTQDNHINRALRFLDHEEKVTKRNAATSQLPPWVSHFYRTVKQMWPFISQFVEKLFRDTIEPAVKNATPYLSSFCFTKIDLGDKPLRVNGVKVYTENVDKRQVIMDLEVSFVGNTEIDIDIKKFYCRAGIKNIQLHGVLRVVMEPLLGDMPLIGALSVFFLKKPWLDINWTGLTNMLDIPGVNGLTDNLILDILCQHLVMPNKIKIPLVGDDQLAQLRFPVPKGVLRIHFLEAQDLLGKDKFLGGLIKGKSDPYGVLEVGTQLFKSKVINDTVNPKWNEVYEALIYDNSSVKQLELELFDEDTDKDDFLGSLMIVLAELQKEHKVDSWFDLEDVSQGKLHLKLEWLSLLPKPDKLDQVLSDIKAGQSKANDGLSSALLVVFLDSARNLPSGKKVTSDPSPFVQFRMGHKHFESKVRYKTNEPVWEEAFTFLVHNPRSQELEVEVKTAASECSLGNLTVPLQSLLEAKDMTLEKHFALRTTGPTSTLKMKMALWVNILSVDKDSGSDPAPSSVPISKSSSSSTPRPSISSDSALKTSSVSDTQDQTPRTPGAVSNGGDVFGMGLSQSNLNIAGSQLHLPGGKEPTPSIASDISNPLAEQELWNRVSQLHNGSSPFPLGEIQLTIRHSSQRNKLIVVVHSCRNLSAFTDHGSDPYVRLYLLPDKRRSGRRKTSTFKKNLNPVYDQTFEFSVSVVELHRRTLDVAVKNGGGLLSKHRGLLGKFWGYGVYMTLRNRETQIPCLHDQIRKPGFSNLSSVRAGAYITF